MTRGIGLSIVEFINSETFAGYDKECVHTATWRTQHETDGRRRGLAQVDARVLGAGPQNSVNNNQ